MTSAERPGSEFRGGVFENGAVVVLSLQSPREKYWGVLLELAPYGVSLCGITIDSFDDFATQLRDGEDARPLTLFLPMHRIERIELDQPCGEIPSIAQRFRSKTSKEISDVFRVEGSE